MIKKKSKQPEAEDKPIRQRDITDGKVILRQRAESGAILLLYHQFLYPKPRIPTDRK